MKEQHLKICPLPNRKILFQANVAENLTVRTDFSRVPKIETFSLDVKLHPNFVYTGPDCLVQCKKYIIQLYSSAG